MKNLSSQQPPQWSVASSGAKAAAAPIPLSFSVPSAYTQTTPDGPDLVDSTTVRFKLSTPLIIPEDANCALTSANFSFTQPNVAARKVVTYIPEGNSRITIQFGVGLPIDYRIDNGLYDVFDVATALNQIASAQGWIVNPVPLFILTGINATQKVIFSLDPAALTGGAFPVGGIAIEFTNPSPDQGFNDSMGPLLGFDTVGPGAILTFTAGGTSIESYTGQNAANFAIQSSYNLYMSFLRDSYQNGAIGQLLYSFPIVSFPANSAIGYQPTLRYPVQASSGSYSAVTIWLTDQGGNRLSWAFFQLPFQFNALISKNKPDGSL